MAALAEALRSQVPAAFGCWDLDFPPEAGVTEANEGAEESLAPHVPTQRNDEAADWGGWGLENAPECEESARKTAFGILFGREPEYTGKIWPQAPQPRRENGDRNSDTGSVVRNGLNVYTYVVQNPWTKFDPTGLKFDDNTFDSKEDRMRYHQDIEDKGSNDPDWINGLGDADEGRVSEYNSRVDSFNSRLEDLRRTPFGSAQYDYLKNHDKTFTLQFGHGIHGEGSTKSFVDPKTLTYRIAGFDYIGVIAHKFMALIQWSNGGSNAGTAADEFPVFDPSDRNFNVEHGLNVPEWMEFQAVRAQSSVNTEWKVLNALRTGIPKGGSVYQMLMGPSRSDIDLYWVPSVDSMARRASRSYNSTRFDKRAKSFWGV